MKVFKFRYSGKSEGDVSDVNNPVAEMPRIANVFAELEWASLCQLS